MPPRAPSPAAAVSSAGDEGIVWETVVCDLCGSSDERALFERGDLVFPGPDSFRVVRCGRCGLVYVNPRPAPESIEQFYPRGYEPHVLPDPDVGGARLKTWQANHDLDRRCRAVADRQAPGRILDVGCSTGRFLARLARWGDWDRHGVELLDAAAREARQRHGLDVRTGRLADAGFADATYDVVTLWDVLEHVHRPSAEVAEVSRILRPGGLLALSTVVTDALDARLFGRYWVGYELPRHLYVFSRRTLARMLADAGLRIVGAETLFGSNYAFADDVRFALQGRGAPGAIVLAAHRLLRSWPWRLATAPAFKTLDRLVLTTPLTVYCRRAR